MQSVINSNSKIVEKIIRNNAGQVFRAYFLVVFRDGKYFAKLVRVEKVHGIANRESRIEKNKIFYLPVFSSQTLIPNTFYIILSVPSPFIFNTFFTSNPIRGPDAEQR